MKRWIYVCIIVLLLITVIWCIYDNLRLTLTTYTVSSERIPSEFKGFRILQISDLHNANFGRNNETLIRTISNAKPDIIVITGDIVDSHRTDYDHAVHVAEAAAAIAPTYYVPGNHEARIGSFGKLSQLLSDAGVTVLRNQFVKIKKDDQQLYMIGLEDQTFTLRQHAETLEVINSLSSVDTPYTILLSHRPELFNVYVKSNVDLVLSGHAHGGQFRLPVVGGLFAPGQGFFPTYDAGQFQTGNTTMIVSRGLGNSIFPFRFNNPPELVLIELN